MNNIDLQVMFDELAVALLKDGKTVDEIHELMTDEVDRVCQEIRDGEFSSSQTGSEA